MDLYFFPFHLGRVCVRMCVCQYVFFFLSFFLSFCVFFGIVASKNCCRPQYKIGIFSSSNGMCRMPSSIHAKYKCVCTIPLIYWRIACTQSHAIRHTFLWHTLFVIHTVQHCRHDFLRSTTIILIRRYTHSQYRCDSIPNMHVLCYVEPSHIRSLAERTHQQQKCESYREREPMDIYYLQQFSLSPICV